MASFNIKDYLNRLFKQEFLTKAESKEILLEIGNGNVEPHQTAALLSCYQMRAITGEELSGFREAMIDLCKPIDFVREDIIDIVGTGGDGKNTFNISTLTSFVVAGAGYKVAKHGNKGVSSPCGSSNVLEHLGYRFSNDYDKLKADLDRANFCFFHAPFFHPAMKEVVPIRKALQVKTFFNVMGPLLNPAQPMQQFSGVYHESILPLYEKVFSDMGINFAVVYAHDGYDEISLTDDFTIITNQGTQIYTPEDLGFRKIKSEDLFGGDTVEEAATIFKTILRGKGTTSQNNVVIVNAAFAIQCFDQQKSIESCLNEAKESLESGKAFDKLQLATEQ
jgi:anthranilate phosphoribosyltransferase